MAIRFGLAAGLITCAIYAVAYLISIESFLSPYLHWGSLSIYIIAMYMLAEIVIKSKSEFKDIVRPLFICFLIANLAFYVFYYIMLHFVDPDIYEMQVRMLTKGLDELDIEDMDTSFTLSGYFLAYFRAAIGGFAIASIIAYTKKQSYI